MSIPMLPGMGPPLGIGGPPPIDPLMGPLPGAGGMPAELAGLLGAPTPAPTLPGMMPQPTPMQAGFDPMMNPMLAQSPTFQFLAAMAAKEDEGEGRAPDTKPKKPKRKAPTIEEIIERSDRIVEFWGPRDARMDEDLAMYRLTEESAGEGEIILKNTPYVVVEKAANMLAAQIPNLQVIPPDNSQKEVAQKVENFLRWSGERWNKTWRRSQLQGSLKHDMAHFLCLRGWVAARVWYDDEAEVDPREHPIAVKMIDPRQVYPQFGDKRMQYVVHRYWTSYGQLIEEWEEAEKEFGENDELELVEVTEYYDDWYHAVLVGDTVVKDVTEHEYGFVPWVIVTGNGSPIRATTADQTSWVSDVGVSIFHGIKGSYRQLNKTLSQVATQVANAANPPTLYYYDPTLNKTPQPLDYTPGTTNYLLYDRERVDPLNLSPRPTEVGPLIDSLLDDVNKGSLPSILWGQGGTQSGFNTSILTDAARDQLFTVVDAMQETLEQINEATLLLIRDLHDGEIGFWVKNEDGRAEGGITLSAEDIEAVGVETLVRYRDISPKDRASMAQLAAMLTDKKLISMETAREEYLFLENPEREEERVLSDLVKMDEDVIKKGLVPAALANTNPELFNFFMGLKGAEMMQPPEQPGGPGGPGGPGPTGAPAGMPGGPAGPGMTPGLSAAGPGLSADALPPLMQPGANPMIQALGSAIGGAGGVGPGVPGAGLPLGTGLPLGL